MKHFKHVGLILVAVLLAACGGNSPLGGGGNGISGSVAAPRGGNVSGTQVLACPVANQRYDCGSNDARDTEVDRNGSYSLDVSRGSYVILALKDANNSGELDEGDYLGFYTEGGDVVAVSPPIDNVDIQMQVARAEMRELE